MMRPESISPIAGIVERARIACETAEQCRQRASRLVLESRELMQRFDELERKMLQSASRRTLNSGQLSMSAFA